MMKKITQNPKVKEECVSLKKKEEKKKMKKKMK